LLPKDFASERSIVIKKTVDQVFAYVVMLKNQNNYSAWAEKDPDMKKEFSGTDGTVGFVSGWKGNKDVGEGEQEIKAISPNARIDYELRFKKPFEATNTAYMTTEAIDANTTKISWGFAGKMSPPMNLMLLFMDMDKEGGKDFEVGLANLKKLLES